MQFLSLHCRQNVFKILMWISNTFGLDLGKHEHLQLHTLYLRQVEKHKLTVNFNIHLFSVILGILLGPQASL